MKITEVSIHNYRSVADATIRLGDYSLLVGANNSGKTNVIDALRTFYEKDAKFEADRDSPKFVSPNDESWVEVEYKLGAAELAQVKHEYVSGQNRVRVRKWFHPIEEAKKGLLAFENGSLSQNRFCGWKSAAEGKLGNVIYIPPVSHLEEHTKLTGPSALRDLLRDILKPVLDTSPAFAKLAKEFEGFMQTVKKEETAGKRSLSGLEAMINEELKGWEVTFGLSISPPNDEEIIKGFIRHTITDRKMDRPMDPEAFGHGLQRYLILTLVRLAAGYAEPRPTPSEDVFSPFLDVILFEEPEAYLHPPQQTLLDIGLRRIAQQEGRQVVAATHSPLFVSNNIDDIACLVRLFRTTGRTEVAQITPDRLRAIFETNQEIRNLLKEVQKEPSPQGGPEAESELEAVRHFLWLNPERSMLFFADHVLIVEGLSERVLTDYLIKTGEIGTPKTGTFVVETEGKFNIPAFMNLLGEMKIPHSVLYDLDSRTTGPDEELHRRLNRLIESSRNTFTRKIDTLPDNLESFLGVKVEKRDRWKASKLLLAVRSKTVDGAKIDALKNKLAWLLAV